MRLIPFLLAFSFSCATPEEPDPEPTIDAVVEEPVVEESDVEEAEVTAKDTFLTALEECKADEECAAALEDMCEAL